MSGFIHMARVGERTPQHYDADGVFRPARLPQAPDRRHLAAIAAVVAIVFTAAVAVVFTAAVAVGATGSAGQSVTPSARPGRATLTAADVAARTATAPADSAIVLPGPPARSNVPADGRLRDDGFAATVLGVATGQATTTERAGPGQQLWVVGLTANLGPPATGGATVDLQAVIAAGTTQTPLPLPQPGPGGRIGPTWFLASLPSGQPDTTLTLSAVGYSQTFSLTHMAREGTSPAVSYRDPTGGATVVLPAGERVQLPEIYTDDLGNQPVPFNVPVQVDSATLGYFAPDVADHTAPSLASAFLTVTLQSNGIDTADQNNLYSVSQAVTPADITLTVPGQAPVAAMDQPGGGGDNPGNEDSIYTPRGGDADGAFPDTYYFPVPATLATGTLTVNPGPLGVHDDSGGYHGVGTPTPTGSTATLTVNVPATAPYQPPPGASPTPAQLTANPTSAGSRQSAGGGVGTIPAVVLAAVIVAGLAAGLLLILRHRNHLATANPGAPPPQDPNPPEPWVPAATPPATPSGWGSEPAATPPPANGELADSQRVAATVVDPEPAMGAPVSSVVDPDPPGGPRPVNAAPPTAPPPTSPVPTPPQAAVLPPGPPNQAETPPAAAVPGWERDWQPPSPAHLVRPAVRVFGVLRLEGWARPPEMARLVELVAYLALHDRPVTLERLRTVLSRRSDADLSAATVHSYLSRLRTNHLDPGVTITTTSAGYTITGVTTDLHHLLAATEAATGSDSGSLHRLAAAIALADRPPMDGGDGRWQPDTDPLTAVRSAVLTLARYDTATNPDRVLWACHLAQDLTTPTDQATADQTVMADALSAAAGISRPGALVEEWDRCQRLLVTAHHTADPRLVDHYRQLGGRPGGPDS